MSGTSTNNGQLMTLVRKGLSIEDAAQALELDVDVARMAISSYKGEKKSIGEIIEEWKPRGVAILMDLAENDEVEPKDRIAACKILLSGEGVIPGINTNSLSERIKNVRSIKIFDAEEVETLEVEGNNRLALVS